RCRPCCLPSTSLVFSSSSCRVHRDLHSFPTRRSSDLADLRVFQAVLFEAEFAGLFVIVPGRGVLGFGLREAILGADDGGSRIHEDRKSTRLNSSHDQISYAVFCLKKKTRTPSLRSSSA